MEFLEESIIQGLVLEAWEEELWGLEANHPNQVQDSWGHLEQVLEGLRALAPGQGWEPSLRVPSRGAWCQVELLVLLQPIRLPRLVLGSEASAELVGLVALEELVALEDSVALAESVT